MAQTIHKGISTQDVVNAIRRAREAGIPRITCSFIVGHPDDTVETVHETIAFAERLARESGVLPRLSVLTPYPGTPVYERPDEFGIKIVDRDFERYTMSRVVCSTRYLDTATLQRLYVEGLLRLMELDQVTGEDAAPPSSRADGV